MHLISLSNGVHVAFRTRPRFGDKLLEGRVRFVSAKDSG